MIQQVRGNLGPRKIQTMGGIERIPAPEELDQLRSILNLLGKERRHETSDELLLKDIDTHLTCDACHMIMPVLRDFKELFKKYNFSTLNKNLLTEDAEANAQINGDWQDVYKAVFNLMGRDSYEDSGIEIKIDGFALTYKNKHTGHVLKFGEGINYLLTDFMLHKNHFADSRLDNDNQIIVEYLVDIIGEDALRMYANANPIAFFDILAQKIGFDQTLMLYRNVDMILFTDRKESPDHGIDLHHEVQCALSYSAIKTRTRI